MKPSLSEDPRFSPPVFDARAAIVNRTHRIVRERAVQMQQRKRRFRDLAIPFVICSVVMWMIAHAVLTVADDHLDGILDGLVKLLQGDGADAGSAFRLVVWFLPLSALTAAIVLLRRARAPYRDDEVSR